MAKTLFFPLPLFFPPFPPHLIFFLFLRTFPRPFRVRSVFSAEFPFGDYATTNFTCVPSSLFSFFSVFLPLSPFPSPPTLPHLIRSPEAKIEDVPCEIFKNVLAPLPLHFFLFLFFSILLQGHPLLFSTGRFIPLGVSEQKRKLQQITVSPPFFFLSLSLQTISLFSFPSMSLGIATVIDQKGCEISILFCPPFSSSLRTFSPFGPIKKKQKGGKWPNGPEMTSPFPPFLPLPFSIFFPFIAFPSLLFPFPPPPCRAK